MSGHPAEPRRRATVRTGARLHFGLLTHRPESGREFGGLGVMIDSPGWTIRVGNAASETEHADQIEAAEEVSRVSPEAVNRVQTIIEKFRSLWQVSVPPLECYIETAISSHRGLGSGTQLALATARAIDGCLDLGCVPTVELAEFTGRGLRSAVGTWGFDCGGLIVDGGKTDPRFVGALVARKHFPTEWRFVLILPKQTSGLSGDEEVSAFAELKGMPESTTSELCRLAMMEFLPAVYDEDFQSAAESLTRYGQLSGAYFSSFQGGVFADPEMESLRRCLASKGFHGFLQTSWGPTCAVLCRDTVMADQACDLIRSQPIAADYDLITVSALNSGAEVEVEEPA